MAKIKVKQIEDLLLADGVITIGKTAEGTSNTIKPLTGVATETSTTGYISGLSVDGNNLVISRTALPAADTFGTGLLSTPEDATAGRTISLDDDYVKELFGITAPTAADGENTTFVTGITYDKETGKFAYTTGTTVAAKDGKLSIAFADTGISSGEIFSANEEDDKTLTLAKVAGSGKAIDVTITDTGNIITATTVEGALAEIAAEIDAMDLNATDVVALNEGATALQAGKISQTDGKVSVENATSIVEFHQAISSDNKVATMADITDAAVSGQEAINVEDKVVSLVIDGNDKVLTQGTNGLLANLSLEYDSNSKLIKLLGKTTGEGDDAAPVVIGNPIDATDFIKDGLLEDVDLITASNEEGLTPGNKYFKFTFKTVQHGTEEATTTVEYLDVESLVDSYTVGNEWIVIDQTTNKISHKTVGGLATGTFGAAADATADAAGESVEFKVPSFTVDAAGHVTTASEKTIKVAIPEAVKIPVYKQGYDSYVVTEENAAAQTFTIAPAGGKQPLGAMVVYLNGQALIEGAGKDYVSTPTGATINNPLPALAYNNNVAVSIEAGDVISYSYLYAE